MKKWGLHNGTKKNSGQADLFSCAMIFIDLMKGDLFWSQIMTKYSFYGKCFYFVQIDSNWFKFSTPLPTAQSFLEIESRIYLDKNSKLFD